MLRPVAAGVALLAAAWPPPARAQAPRPALDTMALRGHSYFLAHDLLEGRKTGERGASLAAHYLATSAERLGLSGAGPGGSFLQPVPVVRGVLDTTASSLIVTGPAAGAVRLVFRSPRSFVPNAGTARTLVSFGGEPAWVGTASDVLSHPERLPPLETRVAILRGVFGADRAAADTLRGRGAVGVIQVVGSDAVFDLYARSRGPSRMWLDPAVRAVSSFAPDIPAVLVRPELLPALVPALDSQADASLPLAIPARRVEVSLALRTEPVEAWNVAALLSGSDAARRDEYVVYTAHYDHLGISLPDASGDSIYNGFADNAAGAAALLAIAQVLSSRPPQRSVLFLWLTGEEAGLLGSDYFAARPLLPLGRIAGLINLDAGAPPAPSVSWHIQGGDRSTLGALAQEVARAAGWEAQIRPASPNSDHYPFLRAGVPAVFLVPSPAPFEGLTTLASDALRQRWDHYHEPGDQWASDYPFAGLARYADFALRLGVALASGPAPRMLTGR